MKLNFMPLPLYQSKPDTLRFQFMFNGVKIPIERRPTGVWVCWIDILKDNGSIELTTLDQPQAEEALSKLLLLHFGPLISMLKEAANVPPANVGRLTG